MLGQCSFWQVGRDSDEPSPSDVSANNGGTRDEDAVLPVCIDEKKFILIEVWRRVRAGSSQLYMRG